MKFIPNHIPIFFKTEPNWVHTQFIFWFLIFFAGPICVVYIYEQGFVCLFVSVSHSFLIYFVLAASIVSMSGKGEFFACHLHFFFELSDKKSLIPLLSISTTIQLDQQQLLTNNNLEV